MDHYNPTDNKIHEEISKSAKEKYNDNPSNSELDNWLQAEKEFWHNISKYQKLSEEFIEKHQDKVNWFCISIYQKLSESFIEKYYDKVDWICISSHQKLSESFIEKHQDKVNWICISQYQKLSEEFIEKHQDKVNWDCISIYQKLSEEFRQKYNIEIPKTNCLYTSKEEKLDFIKKNTNYEIIDDEYILAYKSTRYNGYSVFNFQYQYEVGKTYESHCDCNLENENSFGLSAWTKEGALEYYGQVDYGQVELYLVKIMVNDIGAIVHKGEKIRCFKLEVLEKVENVLL